MRTALVLIVLGIAVCAAAAIAGSILVAPSPHSVPDSALNLPHEAVLFPSESGSTLHGWYVAGSGTGTVVLMHGVRANRLGMLGRAALLHEAGYSVLLFDFQAHGESPGEHITMGYLEALDARAAVEFAKKRKPGQFVGVVGVSLGGAAALLGAEPLAVNALVLEAVYPNIGAAVRNRLEMRVGSFAVLLSPLLLLQLKPRLGVDADDLSPQKQIARIRAPVLIIAGAEDRHTTIKDTEALYEAAPSPKSLWVVPGAAHVDFAAYSPSEYKIKVLSFLNEYRNLTADTYRSRLAPRR